MCSLILEKSSQPRIPPLHAEYGLYKYAQAKLV